MAAAEYNIYCDQGSTLSLSLTYKDSNEAPVNLTGYTARMQVRTEPNASSTLLSLTSGSGITLGGSAGTIAIQVPASTTEALPNGNFIYDLEIVTGSTVTKLIRGAFRVRAEVTK